MSRFHFVFALPVAPCSCSDGHAVKLVAACLNLIVLQGEVVGDTMPRSIKVSREHGLRFVTPPHIGPVMKPEQTGEKLEAKEDGQ